MTQTLVEQQLLQMVQMALFGWLMLFTADEKKALAFCGHWSYWKKTAGDFCFCLLWGILFWLFLLWINGGLLRNYIFFGMVAGGCLYHCLCRRWCYPVCVTLAKGILFVSHWLLLILLFPWRMWYCCFWQPCSRFWKKIYQERQEFLDEGENIIENKNNFST